MTPPPHISPADWERMSWHQRAKATTAWTRRLNQLEAERPPATPDQTAALRAIIAAINDALHQARLDNQPTTHGTKHARARHKAAGEPYCDDCALRRHPIEPHEIATMHTLAARGMSQTEIARRTGRSRHAVAHHLKQTERKAAA